MIRGLILLLIVGGLVVCGATVKMGKRTTFGHIKAIWESEPTQDMVDGVKEKAGPLVDKAREGIHEATKDDAAPKPAKPATPVTPAEAVDAGAATATPTRDPKAKGKAGKPKTTAPATPP